MFSEGKVPPAATGSSTSTRSARVSADGSSSGDSIAAASQSVSAAISSCRIYLELQLARLRVAARNFLLIAIIGIVAAIVAATILVSATVLLCIGVADGLGMLLGGRIWAGDLITGILVLGTILVSVWFLITRLIRGARQRTILEYQQHSKPR